MVPDRKGDDGGLATFFAVSKALIVRKWPVLLAALKGIVTAYQAPAAIHIHFHFLRVQTPPSP